MIIWGQGTAVVVCGLIHRETIIDPPKIDMVNEEIINANEDEKEKIVTLITPNKQCSVTFLALPLPSEAVSSIETHHQIFIKF